MDLELYMYKHKLSINDMVKILGMPYMTVYSYVRKIRNPLRKNAKKIHALTNGEVSMQELMTGVYTTDLNPIQEKNKNFIETKLVT